MKLATGCVRLQYTGLNRHVEFYPAEILFPVPGEKKTPFEKRCTCIGDGPILRITASNIPECLGVEIHDESDVTKTVVVKAPNALSRLEPFRGTIVFIATDHKQEVERVEVPVTILGGGAE